jgi:hypothetical protein
MTNQSKFMIVGSHAILGSVPNPELGTHVSHFSPLVGRDKDRLICMALLKHRYVLLERALPLIETMPIEAKEQRMLRERVRRWPKSNPSPDANRAIRPIDRQPLGDPAS